MLKMIAQVTAAGSFVIVVAFIGLVLFRTLFAPTQPVATDNGIAVSQSEDAASDQRPFGAGGSTAPNATPDDVIAEYTKWLAILTALLVLTGMFQIAYLAKSDVTATAAADAANKSAQVAKEALVEVQRAFVFPADLSRTKGVEFATGRIVGWNFIPIWKNSGTTPALRVEIRSAGRTFPSPLPDDYAFPESFDAVEAFIGPQMTMNGGTLGLESFTIEQIKRGEQFLYIWGSVEYDDVFTDSPRHRTEFCTQVIMAGDFTSETNNAVVMSACNTRNRSYNIDRNKPRKEYDGPEREHLGALQTGTKLAVPPDPL